MWFIKKYFTNADPFKNGNIEIKSSFNNIIEIIEYLKDISKDKNITHTTSTVINMFSNKGMIFTNSSDLYMEVKRLLTYAKTKLYYMPHNRSYLPTKMILEEIDELINLIDK